MTLRFVKTTCPRDCYDTCSLLVTVEGGKIIKVEGDPDHPITRGFTCPRGAADRQRVYSEKRILYPHIKDKVGKFQRVSWNEALDKAVFELKTVLQEHGPSKVLHLDYAGNMGFLTEPYTQRLWNALGAAAHDSTICSASGHAGLALHYGRTYGVEPDELREKRLILFWGFNAKVSAPHTWALAVKARNEQGAVIAAIDPRRSETAEAADLWLAPRPSSDIALAFGVARILIERNIVDLDFIEEWTYGYPEFEKEAMKWTPERIEEITGIDRSRVEALANAYAQNRPSTIMIGIGLQKSFRGADLVRAVSLLPPLTGHHRGFYYSNTQGRYLDQGRISGASLTEKKRRMLSQVGLGKTLERGEINFLYVNNMNPVITLPNQGSFRMGLKRDDLFLVVHETHWTETTAYADIVLPSPTYLEKDDLVVGYAHSYVTKSNKAVEPIGESREEIWVTTQIAKRLGLEEKWLYHDPWRVLQDALEDAFLDGTFDDLMEGATLRMRVRPRMEYQAPSGKLEFTSQKAFDLGFTPLPLHNSPSGEGYTLLTTAIPKYTHTQFQDIYGPIPQITWINPADAASLGIENSTHLELSNKKGAIIVEAVVTDKVLRGILWSPRLFEGLEGEPQNLLMSGDAQEIGGGPVFNSTKVYVKTKKS